MDDTGAGGQRRHMKNRVGKLDGSVSLGRSGLVWGKAGCSTWQRDAPHFGDRGRQGEMVRLSGMKARWGWTLAAPCKSGPGCDKALEHLPQLRDGGGEAHHVLVAGLRLGAGVAAAVLVPVAIFHCGTKMRAPQPGEPGGPDQAPPADRPTRAGAPRACAPHSRRCSSSRSR